MPLGGGGATRWNDRRVIGYQCAAPDPDGILRTLDLTKPAYDPSRNAFDGWSACNLRLSRDRIRMKV